MARAQILGKRHQVSNSRGEPLAAGTVELFEPNTQTYITVYGDSGLTTAIPNPVRLSGSGRAEIWVSRDCDVVIKDRNGNVVVEELNANPDELGGEDSGLVPNGSFETDTNADNVPDGWTLVNFSGSSNSIDTSESSDGNQSFRFTSAGVNGGGTLETTDFFPVNDTEDLRVDLDIRATAAVRNIVRVRWFDISQVFISNTDAYDSTATPSSYTELNLLATPPANARFAKLVLIGGQAGTATPGSTFFDGVNVFYPLVVSGVFDNITIQDNDIISTNANGDINITPNGTGRVVLSKRLVNNYAGDGALLPSGLFSSTRPQINLEQTGAAANNRLWRIEASGEAFKIAVVSDAGTAVDLMTVQRTANAIDSIDWNAVLHTFSGIARFDRAGDSSNPSAHWQSTRIVQRITETDAPANGQIWTWDYSGGNLSANLVNDAISVITPWMALTRSGTTVSDLAFSATNFSVSGTSFKFTGATMEIENVAPIFILDRASGTADPHIRFDLGGSANTYIGTAGTSGGLVAGSVAGDLVLRTISKALHFTGDDGATIHFSLSAAGVLTTPNASAAEVGFKGMPKRSVSSNGNTIAADAGKMLDIASGVTLTIDDSVHPDDTVLGFICVSGSATIAISGATLYLGGTGFGTSGSRTLAAGGMATAYKYDTNTWVIQGTGLT